MEFPLFFFRLVFLQLEEIKSKEKAIAVLQRDVSRDSLSSIKQHFTAKKQQPFDKTNSSSAKVSEFRLGFFSFFTSHSKRQTLVRTKLTII